MTWDNKFAKDWNTFIVSCDLQDDQFDNQNGKPCSLNDTPIDYSKTISTQCNLVSPPLMDQDQEGDLVLCTDDEEIAISPSTGYRKKLIPLEWQKPITDFISVAVQVDVVELSGTFGTNSYASCANTPVFFNDTTQMDIEDPQPTVIPPPPPYDSDDARNAQQIDLASSQTQHQDVLARIPTASPDTRLRQMIENNHTVATETQKKRHPLVYQAARKFGSRVVPSSPEQSVDEADSSTTSPPTIPTTPQLGTNRRIFNSISRWITKWSWIGALLRK